MGVVHITKATLTNTPFLACPWLWLWQARG
jgi:hypothetical protein